MPSQEHLRLQTVRLRPAEKWGFQGEGMAFVLTQSGAGRHVFGTATRCLGPGDVLVLSGPATGMLSPSEGGEVVFAWFSLCLEHLYPLFGGLEISILQTMIEGLKGAKIYPASGPLARVSHQLLGQAPHQFNLESRSQLLRVAAVTLSVEFDAVCERRGGFVRIEEHMVQVFEKLTNAELLSLSVVELAERFGCSRRHLNRLFHQYFGISVSTLKMEMRLLKAITLLRNPDAKVTNVAEDCGFNHLGLFTSCFKRRFGCSPGQWRELASNGQRPAAAPINGDGNCQLRTIGLCPWAGKSGAHDGLPPPEAETPRNGGANRVHINDFKPVLGHRPNPGMRGLSS